MTGEYSKRENRTIDWLVEACDAAINKAADKRTDSWFLVHSPWPPFLICIVYIVFCANCRRITQNLPALTMRLMLIVYNFSLVALSMYMVYEFFMSSYLAGYSLFCQPVDYSNDPIALRMASVCWWYFFSKYIELLDTLFFVLRKKYNQVSFLHVYHHSSMLINWWLGVKYVPGGTAFFIGLINSFVHVIMYTYYGVSAIGPHMQKYLWWKKYLTRLQLIQFVLIMIQSGYVLFTECDYQKWLLAMVFFYQITLILLFGNFYRQSYRTKKQDSIKEK